MSPHTRLIIIVNQLHQRPARSVQIALGELFSLTEDQLRAQWAELTKGTPLAKTKLVIHRIRAEQQCMACFEKYYPAGGETPCPFCGSVGAKVLAGEEFHLESIEAEDE